MDRKPTTIHIIRLLTQQVEQLRVDHGNEEVKGTVRIRHDEEQGSFFISQRIQLQFVISSHITDLATIDELAVLDGSKCILQLRGVRPFLSDKYDLTQHPNYKYTSDYDKRNEFSIEQFLSRRLKLKANDQYEVVFAE